MKSFIDFIKAGAVAVAAVALTACNNQSAPSPSSAKPVSRTTAQPFTILAGSELKDVEQAVKAFGTAQGVEVKMVYTGSLDAVDRLSEGGRYDAVWLSHGKYLQLIPDIKSKIKASEKTMYSRVSVGVRADVANKLGLKQGKTGWKELLGFAKEGKLRFAMTNPTGSNTGFVTLVGVAAEFSGKGDALEEADIPQDKLKQLFSAQTMTGGSSGELAEKFIADPNKADALINYESVLKSVSARGTSLTIITPREGVITADYPLMLTVDSTNPGFYNSLVDYVRSDQGQSEVATATGRTPLSGSGDDLVVNELPFPSSLKVVDALLKGYGDSYSKPAKSYFVLDVSGSMDKDNRIGELKTSMKTLALGDGSVTGRFAALRAREQIQITPFSNQVFPAQQFVMNATGDNRDVLNQFSTFIDTLRPDGGTAIYDALQSVYSSAQEELKTGKTTVSVVLLTDGINNNGISSKKFLEFVAQQGLPAVPVYAIIYGEANVAELKDLAAATGGRVFDARTQSLKSVMKSIRSYQ